MRHGKDEEHAACAFAGGDARLESDQSMGWRMLTEVVPHASSNYCLWNLVNFVVSKHPDFH